MIEQLLKVLTDPAALYELVRWGGYVALTAIVFTEALSHGTLPWTGAGERRTLFYKYSTHPSSWSAAYYDASRWPDLTLRQREILEGPNARYSSRPTKPT